MSPAFVQNLARKFDNQLDPPSRSVAIQGPDGQHTVIGSGQPALVIHVRNHRGEKALRTLKQLDICEAYIDGDIDLEGDLIEAAALQRLLSDREPWIKLWRQLKPRLLGRARCNPGWIEKHYDQHNIQLIAADRDYHTYTPGIYASDEDTLERGAVRKLQAAFDALNLGPGRRLLDVGCGWGGFLRYCAARGVEVTGITLSKHQLAFARETMRRDNLSGTVLYQDFFTFMPDRKYDSISLMGVIEDLSDYRAVIERLMAWLEPRGRVYLDFATAKERFGTSSFITKYIWPGLFRMVYLPELVEAVWRSRFQLVALDDDRPNYYRWARDSYCRWMDARATVVARAGEALWRTFRIMHAGTAHVMSDPDSGVSAYRMVLQLPVPAAGAGDVAANTR